VLEEGGGCGQDFGGKWGLPGAERGGCGEVGVVQDVCCEEVGKGREAAACFSGMRVMRRRVWQHRRGGKGKWGANEAGALGDFRVGALELGWGQVQVMEMVG
jgi:hypothetical protein